MNGDDVWGAIGELRREQAAQGRALAVNETQVADLRDDINAVGRKVEGSEGRVKKYVDDAVGGLDDRIEGGIRWIKWVLGIAVPLAAALAGALITRGGP